MSDPLVGFDWNTLYARYDAACCGFDPNSKHLRGIYRGTPNDRALYSKLLAAALPEARSQLDTDWYEAFLLLEALFSIYFGLQHCRVAKRLHLRASPSVSCASPNNDLTKR